jgi:hypothetical protein
MLTEPREFTKTCLGGMEWLAPSGYTEVFYSRKLML